MHICQDCGGQNGLHFPKCQHYRAPRHNSASQTPTAQPTPGVPPYQRCSEFQGGNRQAGDPREPHRSMPSMPTEPTDEMKLIDLLGPNLDIPFTHRDKGGRYKLLYTPLPAGQTMRNVGDTVVYTCLNSAAVYVRDLSDFVAIMQRIELSDN